MKTDARVRYTKKVLRESLLYFLRFKSITEISVKEVCGRAEINRATFYKHYKDCCDLLEQIENQVLEEYLSSMENIRSLNVRELVGSILDMIDKNRDLCELLAAGRMGDGLVRKMMDVAHREGVAYWRTLLVDTDEDTIEMLFLCLANGLLTLILYGSGKYSREKLTGFADEMVKSCLAPYMKAKA